TGAVIMLTDITAGPLPHMGRGKFHVNNGELLPLVGFSAVHDRVELRTFDSFSNDFEIADLADGKTVFSKRLAANTAKFKGLGAMDKKGLIAWNLTQWRKLAKPVRTEPFRERGFFSIRCKRHPWQVSYLVVFPNPYITLPSVQHRRWGTFRMSKVPAGTWTLEAWHPKLQAVQRTRKITVTADETLEFSIAFRPPAEAGAP
ncbi:hypothetical protein LCGC14_2182640, partial [marine sediment metagenome]